MEKIDTDYKQQNWKIKANLFKLFNRDCSAPLSHRNFGRLWATYCVFSWLKQSWREKRSAK